MQLKDDIKRLSISWRYDEDRVCRDCFFMDFYSYACLELNIRKAKESKHDINLYYSREGWIRLLMYYARTLEEMAYEYVDAYYMISQQDMYELQMIQQIPIKIIGHDVFHDTGLTNTQILKLVMKIGNYIERVIEMETDIKLDNLELQIKTLKHGYNQQEDGETKESRVEEDYWRQY